MKKTFGFVYETTNLITNKKYIGSHIGPTADIYWGSGVDFTKDLKKYGDQNMSRVILGEASDVESLKALEIKWLESVDAKNNPVYYNRSNRAFGVKSKVTADDIRPLCQVCKTKPSAIICHKNEKTYYRKVCDTCGRAGKKVKPGAPLWARSGYTKKPHCELCNFKFKLPSQSLVFHIDGNLSNNNWHNLKTVCLNCQQELHKLKVAWKPAPIVPDF